MSDTAIAYDKGRWSPKFHEFITVDELSFYRRRKPSGIYPGITLIFHFKIIFFSLDHHTKSNICLYNKSEPSIPFSALKTEYNRSFKDKIISPRPGLERRSTSLRLGGELMSGLTEQQSMYISFPEDEAIR